MTKDVFIKEVRDAEAMLYHISKSILKNDSDCGDAVQETILKAYEKLPTLKKEKYFRTWITRILINECKGILRKRKNVIPYEEYMEQISLENSLQELLLKRILQWMNHYLIQRNPKLDGIPLLI